MVSLLAMRRVKVNAIRINLCGCVDVCCTCHPIYMNQWNIKTEVEKLALERITL